MGSLPKPPEFLFKPQLSPEYDFIELDNLAPPPQKMPDLVPNNIYQAAIEQRRSAEMNYAEIYSQYLEVVAFNERLLRKIRRLEKFKGKMRPVFNNLKNKDNSVHKKLAQAQLQIKEREDIIHDLQLEIEALKISNSAHDESFKAVSKELEASKQDASEAQDQFRLLSEEFENRGFFLTQAEEKLKDYLEKIDQMSNSMSEIQVNNSKLRNENLIFQSKLAEITKGSIFEQNGQITSVLQNSIYRLQKKVSILEQELNETKKERTQPPAQTAVSIEEDFSLGPKSDFQERWKGVLNQGSPKSKNQDSDPINAELTLTESGELI